MGNISSVQINNDLRIYNLYRYQDNRNSYRKK